MFKEKAERLEDHMVEIKEVIVEARSNVVEVVWEAKIQLTEDIKNTRYWDVARWRKALAKLTSRPVNACQDPTYQR